MKEKKWQVLFNQYLREKRFHGFFELKQTSAKSFPFSKIELHQYEALRATEQQGLVWKLSDEDQRQKPCDTICIPPLPSYIVIKFPDGFYCIRIQNIIEMKVAGLKSVTIDIAKKIAEKIIRI